MTEAEILAALPQPPQDATFVLLKVEKVTMPHPYCITARHVAFASDHCGGMLGEAAIEGAERAGVRCGMPGCELSYDRHETNLTLFVAVPNNRGDLNAIPGLHAYLLSIKPQMIEFGIEGIAFPNKRG